MEVGGSPYLTQMSNLLQQSLQQANDRMEISRAQRDEQTERVLNTALEEMERKVEAGKVDLYA